MRWLRTASPETVADETEQHLTKGVPEEALWTAGILTANRHLNNRLRDGSGQASQALIGTHVARGLAQGQEGSLRRKLLVQSLRQTVCDLHNPYFSPYELLPFWPHCEQDAEETTAALYHALRVGNAMGADHCFVGLSHQLSHTQLLDLLFTITFGSLSADAHAFHLLSTAIASSAWLPWPQQLEQLRWVVRCSSGAPRPTKAYQQALQLAATYHLAHGAPRTAVQPELIQPVCAALSTAADDGPELVAQAMSGDQIAPQTILAAAACVVCEQILRDRRHDAPPAPIDARPDATVAATMQLARTFTALRRMLPHMSPSNGTLAAILAGDLLKEFCGPLATHEYRVRRGPTASHRYRPYGRPAARADNSPGLLAQLQTALRERNSPMATEAVQNYADAHGAPELLIARLIDVAATTAPVHVRLHLDAMLWEFRHGRTQNHCPQTHRGGWPFLMQAAHFLVNPGSSEPADLASMLATD